MILRIAKMFSQGENKSENNTLSLLQEVLKRQHVVLGGEKRKRTPCYALEKKLQRRLTQAGIKASSSRTTNI